MQRLSHCSNNNNNKNLLKKNMQKNSSVGSKNSNNKFIDLSKGPLEIIQNFDKNTKNSKSQINLTN